MQRIVRDGNEIGNHTYTHPDISEISNRQLDLEINLTERLFESKLGVQPLYFRPPYDNDEEPDTDDEAAPVWRIQQDGLTIIGSKIDTNDWNEHPRKTPAEIIDSVLAQLQTMKTKPQFRGSIILMHDGGGDRSVTVAGPGTADRRPARPRLHHRSRLRAHGQDHRAGNAAAHLLAARAHHPRFHRLLRARSSSPTSSSWCSSWATF